MDRDDENDLKPRTLKRADKAIKIRNIFNVVKYTLILLIYDVFHSCGSSGFLFKVQNNSKNRSISKIFQVRAKKDQGL